MGEIDSKGRIGELEIICLLEKERIKTLKGKINLLGGGSKYKNVLEKRLLILETKQAERKAEFEKLSLEQMISSSEEETENT